MESGLTTDALIDMSGGLKETFDLKTYDADELYNFFSTLFQAYHKKSILSCSIKSDPRVKEARMANGLVRGHAYTITRMAVLKYGNTRVLR